MASESAAATVDEDTGPIWPEVVNGTGAAPVLLICEHASRQIPSRYGDLGLSHEAFASHAVWDPGAYEVARGLSRALDAPLIAARVSRVVFDCNRPPEAPDAMPESCEIYEFPGNSGLSAEAKRERRDNVYRPFSETISKVIKGSERIRAIATVHSFTPVYFGRPRSVQIGVLHDSDRRLADRMLTSAAQFTDLRVADNEPYGPEDGVTHTLREHGEANALLNVMLEIRNDLIGTPQAQSKMSALLARWLEAAIDQAA